MSSILSSLKNFVTPSNPQKQKKTDTRKLHLEPLEVREMLSVTPFDDLNPPLIASEIVATVDNGVPSWDKSNDHAADGSVLSDHGVTLFDEPLPMSASLPPDAFDDSLEEDDGTGGTRCCCCGCGCCGSVGCVWFGEHCTHITEGCTGYLTVYRSWDSCTPAALTVGIQITNNTTTSCDYTANNYITFPANVFTVNYSINAVADNIPEWNEKVTFTLILPTGNYSAGPITTAYACIYDNDEGEISPDQQLQFYQPPHHQT